MLKPELLDDLVARLQDAMPDSLRDVKNDLKENFRHILSSRLNQLDLVTREEFDVQTNVLARAREQLLALRQQLDQLEAKIDTTSSQS